MKKILVMAAAFVALQTMGQVRFGAKAGVLFANQKSSVGGEDFSSKLGLNVGLITDISLGKSVSLQTGAGFNSRGAREAHAGHHDNYIINVLEIPANVIYKVPAGKGKFVFGAGPNFGINLSAKIKEHNAPDEEIKIGNGTDEIKRFDLGINFVTGYEFTKNWFAQINYNIGTTNLANVSGFSQKTQFFGVTLGYFFGK